MDLGVIPDCIESLDDIYSWAGTGHQWILFEFVIFCSYIFGMFILQIKSRCIPVVSNQNAQFEPLYMSYMANKIADAAKFDFMQIHKTKLK